MIITKPKDFSQILESLDGEEKIFLVGCSECATVCQTGGEKEIEEMKSKLSESNKQITGWVVLDPGCNLLEAKKEFRKRKEQLNQDDSLLVMSCGGGVQIAQEASDKMVHPANDTLFLGTVERFGQFKEYCSMCGECILDLTGGICPATRCAKGLLNGPCGGASDGKCEANPDNDCVWIEIYEELEARGELDSLLSSPVQIHDYSINARPSARNLSRNTAKGEAS